jgi:hypothetical protein
MRRIDLIGAFVLIAWGGILVLKPNLFVRGIWKRTDIAQRLLSPKGYLIYTRTLGLLFILGGFVWLAIAPTRNCDSPRQAAPSTNTPNQSMKPTAPYRNAFSVFATTPCRGLSLSR